MGIIGNNFFNLRFSLFTWIIAASRGQWACWRFTEGISSLLATIHVGIHSTVKVREIWYIRHYGTTRVFTWSPHQTIDFRILWFRSESSHIINGHWTTRGILLHKYVKKWIVLSDGKTSFRLTSAVLIFNIVGSLWQHFF